MSVIVSADESGRLLVSAYSASLLASLNLGDVFQPRASGGVQQARPLGAGAVPLSIAQSADLCQVGVLAQDTAEGQEELKLAVIDTSVLAERGAELQYLSRQVSMRAASPTMLARRRFRVPDESDPLTYVRRPGGPDRGTYGWRAPDSA